MTETFTAYEIQFDHSQRIALETNTITDSYETQSKHLDNHESFLVCPGKQPIKIAANYAVSIHIYFDNFVLRKNTNHQHDGDNGDIYLHITDEGFHDNYDNSNNSSNQPNNQINVHKLIKGKNTTRGQSVHGTGINDKSNETTHSETNLIESNHNKKNVNRTDSKIKHFVDFNRWILNRQTSDKAKNSQNVSTEK